MGPMANLKRLQGINALIQVALQRCAQL